MLLPSPLCPVCRSSRRKLLGHRGDRPIPELLSGVEADVVVGVFACRSCRHVWCDPIPVASELLEMYEAVPTYFHGSEETRLESARSVIARLSSYAKGGRFLDVGCGRGFMLQAAAEAGWEPFGIEPTASFARVASQHGPVHVGYLDGGFTADNFDAIAVMAVLEHVPDPVALLRHARRVARPGTVLVLNAPNAHRPEAVLLDLLLRARRTRWTVRTAPLQEPFHLSEFSRQSVDVALRAGGWSPVELEIHLGHNPYPVPAHLARMIRLVEALGARVGRGLNIDAVAVAV